jgi:hypothetical protein
MAIFEGSSHGPGCVEEPLSREGPQRPVLFFCQVGHLENMRETMIYTILEIRFDLFGVAVNFCKSGFLLGDSRFLIFLGLQSYTKCGLGNSDCNSVAPHFVGNMDATIAS